MRQLFLKKVFPLSVCLLFFVFVTGCQNQESPSVPDSQASSEQKVESKPVSSQPEKTEPAKLASIEYINSLTEQQIVDGWVNLFDGQTLFGWQAQNEVNWSVKEKQITANEGPVGLLLTKVRYADFELALDYKLSPGGNSGIFLRCGAGSNHPATDCYEINLADEHPQGFLTGSFVGLHQFEPGKPTVDGKWHHLEITANKNAFSVLIDGEISTQFQDERSGWLRSGLIGLQKNSGQVAFRNIQLKPLDQVDLFNGKDLAGWREVPGSKSKFEVVEEAIHVTNGAGFLETEQTYDNFILQFQAKTYAAELNSGLFFRALPGTEKSPSNGYEVQIHNGFNENDRNQPNNAGTGGIFRRVDARRVVSSDHKWCTMTLVADGPQISTWVDGYQVVDWKDTRAPHENPRKGKRLAAGHLSLQGHDPTTDLSFRKFKLSQLP